MSNIDIQSNSTQQVHDSTENNDIYWQLGKSVSSSFLHLYEKQLWTDVSIRYMDHVTDDMRAHKLVLAARSPVFSAMFYGASSNEVHMLEHSRESVDAFLRYLYADFAPLDVDIAIEVLQLSHFYQVSNLVDLCCDVISGALTVQNVCQALDLAILYNLPMLTESSADFIDVNAAAVLKSDVFLSISRDTLEYLLKGDTLFAREKDIIRHTYQWAENKLILSNQSTKIRTLRYVLGNAFCFLRYRSLTTPLFFKLENECPLHYRDECLDITKCRFEKTESKRPKHTDITNRVEIVHTISFRVGSGNQHLRSRLVHVMKIPRMKNIKITELSIAVPMLYVICNEFRRNYACVQFKGELPLQINVECTQVAFQQERTLRTYGGKLIKIAINPPLMLTDCEKELHTLEVTIASPSIEEIRFYSHEKVVRSLELVVRSNRDRSLEMSAVTPRRVEALEDRQSRCVNSTRILGRPAFHIISPMVAIVVVMMQCFIQFVLLGEVFKHA